MLRKRLFLAIIASLPGVHAVAQEAGEEARSLDQVVVTGTRVADRTIAESASPIDVIGPEALVATGTSELATALARVLPSLNFPRPSLTDGTDAVRPAQLRGLSPDQTLVLVNGKRRHTAAILNVNGTQGRGSAPVDLNAIPIGAIERVEVLRDGAAAQYGSDAIAGVVNIVLKRGRQGGSASLGLGQYSSGDGRQVNAAADAALDFGPTGWAWLSAEYSDADPTNRAGVDFRFPGDVSYGRKNHRFGDPQTESLRFFVNSGFQIAENTEFYAFGNFSRRDSESAGNYRQAGNAANIASIYPEGFLPLIATESGDLALVAGLRGQSAGGWRWDASVNQGENELEFGVNNSLNRSLGLATPTSFYAGALENEQTVFNFDVARELGFANPATLAFGAEYRRERYAIGAGEVASYVIGPAGGAPGAQVFPGFQPGDAGSNSRHSRAVYVELDSDLGDAFNAALALRYEDYSDFGDALAGKLALRYAFSETASLRATVSNGFRAPSLAQQYYSTTSSVLISGEIYETRTFPVNSDVARAFGALPLQAEESANVSLGLVIQPLDALTLSADIYQIEIDDRIVLSENLIGDAVEAYLAQLGFPGVRGGRYFTNAVDTRTRGIDLVAGWRVELGAGSLDLAAGYNHNDTEITRIEPNAPQLEALGGLQRIGRAETGRIEVGSPKDKITLGADYRLGGWGLRGGLTRYGDVTVRHASNPAQDQTLGAKWLLDLALDYRFDNWTFTLGADNALDQYPDETIAANWGNPASAPSGLFRYSSYSPFGFNGAYLYARVGVTW
ncbi:MAG: TonB-dependent receptor [Lysobacteraceae bacterium]